MEYATQIYFQCYHFWTLKRFERLYFFYEEYIIFFLISNVFVIVVMSVIVSYIKAMTYGGYYLLMLCIKYRGMSYEGNDKLSKMAIDFDFYISVINIYNYL